MSKENENYSYFKEFLNSFTNRIFSNGILLRVIKPVNILITSIEEFVEVNGRLVLGHQETSIK